MPINELNRLMGRGSSEAPGGLATLLKEGERRFHAILCHIGVNRNGQELTLEEARKAVANSPPFPIRMTMGEIKKPGDNHPVTVGEIIGESIGFELVEDQGEPHIAYVGQVWDDLPSSRHAYNVIKAGFYSFDSYETEYAEGECSACHARFKNPKDICNHLTRVGNMVVGTSRGHVIMHDVRITGVAMLDHAGADPDARVKAVAHLVASQDTEENMSEKIEKESAPEVKAPETKVVDAAKVEADKAKEEIVALKKDLAVATAALKVFQDRDREARCDAIMATKERLGKTFDDKAREAEKKGLMDKSEAELGAIEALLEEFPEPEETPEADGKKEAPPKANAAQAKPEEQPGLKAVADGAQKGDILHNIHRLRAAYAAERG